MNKGLDNISVVIPNYNGKELLAKNLPKVIAACKNCEIIVVDDASVDQSVDFIQSKFPKVRVIKHKKNQRFATACNTGVKNAQADIVIVLNNDVSPSPKPGARRYLAKENFSPKENFVKALVRHFKDKKVFSVGCKEVQLKNGKKTISGRTEGEFKRGFLVHWQPKDQESKDTLWTFGGSMAIDRGKYLQLGGMDELYSPAYWEDIDLCWRARKKGWKILFEKNAVVYHNHETTNISVFGKTKMDIYAYRNQILFVWKNIRGRQLLEHFFWLPYHLLFTTIRSKGLFLIAFLQAVARYIFK